MLTTIGLPVALGIIMFGLGLTLTLSDFARVARAPKAVVVVLVTQLIVLPLVCLGLVLAFQLPPVLAVGMMMLSAAPGGPGANLYSYLCGGDVALNISLTAINSVLAVVTLPIILNLSLAYFLPSDGTISMQPRQTLEVFATVLLPVVVGMIVRRFRPSFARAMETPVRIGSIVILVAIIAGSIVSNREILIESFGQLALIAALFATISLTAGFFIPRLFAISRPQAIASAFEIGLHNGVLAIVIAQTVIGSVEMSLPAAVYSVLALLIAAGFGVVVRRLAPGGLRREGAPETRADTRSA